MVEQALLNRISPGFDPLLGLQIMKTCKHYEIEGIKGLCVFCKANRKAAYDLTGSHDPEEQKAYWDRVGEHLENIRKERFLQKLAGKVRNG